MSGVILHCGGQEIPYEQLKEIPTPEPTNTWTPIPHVELLDSVKREVTSSGLTIQKEVLAVSNGSGGAFGDRFFGLLDIKSEDSAFNLALAIRNSCDRSVVAGLCVGSHVFVCDNLAFSAEIVIMRRHTRLIRQDLPRLINQAVGQLGDLRERQAMRIEAYQNTPISDPQFHDLLVRSMDSGVLCASKVPKVLGEFRHPTYPEFEPRTVWSGFNAFTEILKSYDLQDLPRRTQVLHGLCDLLSHVN